MVTKSKVAGALKEPSTELTLWEVEMQAAVTAQVAAEVSEGGFKSVSTKSGILSVDGAAIPGNELNAVIVAAIHENQFFEGDYNPDNPASPVCYAFSVDGQEMKPHEASPKPQCATCSACSHNEWGSSDKGKGKACKNVRRLALVLDGALDSVEELRETEPRVLKVPVMSVKNWSGYVNHTLADLKRPGWGVVTAIKPIPDAKSQFRITFRLDSAIDFAKPGLYEAMKKKTVECTDSLMSAYPVFSDANPIAARSGKGPAKLVAKAAGKSAAKALPVLAKRGGKY